MSTETRADIAELVRERDALNAQIDAATKSRDEAYADELAALQGTVAYFADEFGLDVAESERKNVRVFMLGGWLSIQFGYPGAEGRSPFLLIQTTGGITADWRYQLPPLAAFTGYLRGLVEYDRETTGEQS
jgi:hypothetical protein